MLECWRVELPHVYARVNVSNVILSGVNDFFLQVVIVGNGAVGKSSMIQRYCRGTFTRDYKKTIGVDFLERIIE